MNVKRANDRKYLAGERRFELKGNRLKTKVNAKRSYYNVPLNSRFKNIESHKLSFFQNNFFSTNSSAIECY